MPRDDRQAGAAGVIGMAIENEPAYWQAEARRLDAADGLARFRGEFHVRPGEIYLDGNSLGLVGRRAEASLLAALDDWKRRGIGGWLEAEPPWFTLAEGLGARVAGLVGADPDEVVVAGSTTSNLHQLLATLYDPRPGRSMIVADELAFPSDVYAIRSHLRLRGLDPDRHLRLVASGDGRTLDEGAIEAALGEDVALAVLPSVVYRSGQLLDLERLAGAARGRGVVLAVDCSHSVGAVPHRLRDWGVDGAFWCSYKYLNGGPGAVGGLFLARRHFGRPPGLAGWFGMRKDRQFAMGADFEPAEGAGGLQVGTPHVLAMAPLVGALEVIEEAGIDAIRAKSLALTRFLRELAEAELAGFGVGCVTPIEDDRRGGHVALTHPEAARVCRALIDAGVIPDHRPPDIIRLAPVALYTSFAEVAEAIHRLRGIFEGRKYEAYPAGRGLVS